MRRIVVLAMAVALAGLGPARDLAARFADSQRIYVTIVDQKGKPVTGLTKEDFAVHLDQAEQEVLSAGPAREPASVVIVTDRLGLNATFTPFDVGEALRDFANTIRKGSPDSAFALTTFDGAVLQVTKLTAAYRDTERALGRLMTVPNDAAFFDGLIAACQELRAAPTQRKVLFTLLAAYRPDSSTTQADVAADALRLSGASLWAVEVRQAEGGNYANAAREQVLDAGSALSGGLHDVVSSRSGLNLATRRAAEYILAQYELVFGPGGGTTRTRLTVQVKRAGLRVLAPGWTAR